MNSHNNDKENSKHRRKYKYLKKIIKGLIIENAALCDEVAKIQESILIVKDERKFLFRKLLEYENDHDQLMQAAKYIPPTTSHNGTAIKTKKKWESS